MRREAACRGFALLVLLGLLGGGVPEFCSEALGSVLTLMSSGTTIILEGNVARARSVAMANGKRNALEAAVGEIIAEPVAYENYDIINENIYRRPERFIDTFRILSEGSRENIYEVTLESIVTIEKLRKTLVTLGLLEEDLWSQPLSFRLEILQVSCSPCFTAVKEYLQNEMEGVEEVALYSISPGRFTLDIVFSGSIEAFQYVLTSRDFEGFRLEPEGMDEEDLRVLMVLTYPEEG